MGKTAGNRSPPRRTVAGNLIKGAQLHKGEDNPSWSTNLAERRLRDHIFWKFMCSTLANGLGELYSTLQTRMP